MIWVPSIYFGDPCDQVLMSKSYVVVIVSICKVIGQSLELVN